MTERMSAAEFRAQPSEKPKRNKYNAKRTLVDGICFDSKAEASYYAALKLRERAGEVTEIEMQRRYTLAPYGIHVAFYDADFVFFDRVACRRRIVDVKGFSTRDFKIKAKLMKACHGIEIEVVR
jgi:hypothetical protein